MSAREDIAAAASAALKHAATPYFRPNTEPGTAYVRRDRIEYPNRLGGVGYWDLVVVLPQDYAAAEKWFDTHIPAVVEAVSIELAVDRVTPQRLEIAGVGVLPVVFISGHREEDEAL